MTRNLTIPLLALAITTACGTVPRGEYDDCLKEVAQLRLEKQHLQDELEAKERALKSQERELWQQQRAETEKRRAAEATDLLDWVHTHVPDPKIDSLYTGSLVWLGSQATTAEPATTALSVVQHWDNLSQDSANQSNLDPESLRAQASVLETQGNRYEAAKVYLGLHDNANALRLAKSIGAETGDWLAVAHIAGCAGESDLFKSALTYGVKKLDQPRRARERLPRLLNQCQTMPAFDVIALVAELTMQPLSVMDIRDYIMKGPYTGTAELYMDCILNNQEKYVDGTLMYDLYLLFKMNPKLGYLTAEKLLAPQPEDPTNDTLSPFARDNFSVLSTSHCGEGCNVHPAVGSFEVLQFLLDYEAAHPVKDPVSDLYKQALMQELQLLASENNYSRDMISGYDATWTVFDAVHAVRVLDDERVTSVWFDALHVFMVESKPFIGELGLAVLGRDFDPNYEDMPLPARYFLTRLKGEEANRNWLDSLPLGSSNSDTSMNLDGPSSAWNLARIMGYEDPFGRELGSDW